MHCVVIAGLGCVAFLLPTPSEGGTLNQAAQANASNLIGGALFNGTVTGAFSYAADAQMRWINLDWAVVTGQLFQFICDYNANNPFDITRVLSRCLFVPMNPPGVPPSPNNTGAFFYRGSFSLVYAGSFLSVLTGQLVVLNTGQFVAYNKTSVVIVNAPPANKAPTLFAYQQLQSPPPLLPPNSGVQAADPRLIGTSFDVSQFLLYVALFLIALPIVSALVSRKRRAMLALTVILMCCIFANVLLVVMQQLPLASVRVLRGTSHLFTFVLCVYMCV